MNLTWIILFSNNKLYYNILCVTLNKFRILLCKNDEISNKVITDLNR